MMTRNTILILSAVALVACGGAENTPSETSAENTPAEDTTAQPVEVTEDVFVQEITDASIVMLGTWKGEMSGKELTVVIEKVDGRVVTGYNILGTNQRSLAGEFEDGNWDQTCSAAFDATLREPGDDEWDGVFTIKFVGYEGESENADGGLDCDGDLQGFEALGSWKANKSGTEKEFTLLKEKVAL